MKLGDKIKQAREDAGLDTFTFLHRIRQCHPTLESTGPASLSQWENGHVERISFHAIDAISHITGKPLSFFSELNDEQPGGEQPDPPHHGDPRGGSGDVLAARARQHRRSADPSKRRTRD